MRVLIVEDEINACEYLRTLISKLRPSWIIIEHLDSVKETINWLNHNPSPDLIFLDIQLSDGISFEIFNHVTISIPIIFTTAYDQFAIQAFKVNSVDYLLKPIAEDDLLGAVLKFEEQLSKNNNNLDFANLLPQFSTGKRNRFLVKKSGHFEFINVDDIKYIISDDSLTFLYTKDQKRHLYTKTLNILIAELDPTLFFQINRKQIVNITSVQKIHPYLNQRLKVELTTKTNEAFIVSRNRTSEFKKWLDS